MGVHEGGGPTLRERAEDREAEAEEAEGLGEVWAVEVPAAQALPGVREDQGVVRRGVDLDLQHLSRVMDGLEARPEDLGDAPEGVRVLDAVRALVALHDLAVLEELYHVPRHEVLPHLLLQAGEPRGARRWAP